MDSKQLAHRSIVAKATTACFSPAAARPMLLCGQTPEHGTFIFRFRLLQALFELCQFSLIVLGAVEHRALWIFQAC